MQTSPVEYNHSLLALLNFKLLCLVGCRDSNYIDFFRLAVIY